MQRLASVTAVLAILAGGAVAQADQSPTPPLPDQAPSADNAAQPSTHDSIKAEPPAAVEIPRTPEVVPTPKSAIQSVAPEEAEAILGQPIMDPEGKDIGRLVDVLVDVNGQPQAAVIDFGGFMGVGNRKIAVHWSVLHFLPGDLKHKITLDMTPDQIKSAPEYLNTSKPAPVVTPASAAPASP